MAIRRIVVPAALVGVLVSWPMPTHAQDPQQGAPAPAAAAPDLRKSVIKITTKVEMRHPTTPWKRDAPQEYGGSGVVIAPGKVLTNAHVVSEASEILVETDQTKLPIQAELLAFDDFRDLALLGVDDAAFIKNHPPVDLLDGLPDEGARVVVMGYPMGGDALSTTSGVVSRTEWADIGMGGQSGMRVQVDAAVNSGNSGGPAFVDGKVAGLAFSAADNAQADNISYLIATEEIKRSLEEGKNRNIDGNCIWDAALQTLENPALRAKLGVSSELSGSVVTTYPGSELQPWDIVTKVNGYSVDNKGMITIEGGRKVSLDCAIGRFVPSESNKGIPVELLRDGKPLAVEVPALSLPDRVLTHYSDCNYPYLIYGPLVVSPLSGDLLAEVGAWMVRFGSPVSAAMADRRPADGRQLVAVCSDLLGGPLSRGYSVMPGQTLKSVNGKTFKNFREFVAILKDLNDEFVTFEFNELYIEPLVFRRSEVEKATENLMDSNGIRRACSKDVADIWEK